MSPKLTEEQLDRNARSRTFIILVSVALLVLIGRLFYLQYWKYDFYLEKSENNMIRENIIRSERGIILDRNGKVLVRNRPSYHVAIVYERIKDSAKLVETLLSFKDSTNKSIFDSALVCRRIAEGRWRKYAPMRIYEDASLALVSLVEEHLAILPGVLTQIESRRDYPYGTLMAHLLGYTAEMTKVELDSLSKQGYEYGDRIGRKGLEQQYEMEFKGQNGLEFIQVDAFGRHLGNMPEIPSQKPIAGQVLTSTIDVELQKVAEQLLSDSVKGALVAINPQNGEILSMVSRPSMNPNIFSMDKATLRREWAQVALDGDAPLNNRAIMGLYPPGSLFKFFTGIAGMEDLGIGADDRPFQGCSGGYRFGNRYQRCWDPGGHGVVSLIDAWRVSCDVYFYQLGLRLGMERINRVATMYGLGVKTGVDIPGEKAGLLMDSAVYNKRFKRLNWRWSRGQILNLAIGQGELVTPIQMANAFAALGHGKALYKAHFLKSLTLPDGQVVQNKPQVLQEIKIRPATQRAVIRGLESVVNAPGGTGIYARVQGVRVGGKTGSAELGGNHSKTHSWFAAVAPLDHPTIAVALVLEEAGHGGEISAPIVGKLLRFYFKGQVGLNEDHHGRQVLPKNIRPQKVDSNKKLGPVDSLGGSR